MSAELSSILNTLKTFTAEKILSTVVLLGICLLVIHVVMRLLAKVLARPRFDQRMQKFILSAVRVLLYVLASLIVADSLGIPISSLLALFSVLGLAVSLAVKDVLGNVAGGLVILFAKPFQIGDYIETDAGSGTVAAIDLTYTQLDTADGLRLMIPNSVLSDNKITNYTQLGTRRIDHAVSASYDDAIQDVRTACLQAVAMTPNILDDPAPMVIVAKYGESSIEYRVRCWSKVDTYWDANYALLENIKTCFDKNGITMTYNHLNIHILENKSHETL